MRTQLDASSELFLAGVQRLRRTVERAQRQITSGKRVETASDAPDQVQSLLQLKAAIARNDRLKINLKRIGTEADVADSALNSAAKLLDRTLTLASQATNEFLDAGTRQGIAEEVRAIQEQMVAATRATVEGRYVFSGDDDRSPPYAVDWTSATGVEQLLSASATRRIEDASGGTFEAGRTAQAIFDARNPDDTPAEGNVFAALNAIRLAIESNDTASMRSSMELVREASAHLGRQTAFYGSLQSRIDNAIDFAGRQDVVLRAEVSAIEDADIAAAALEITQGNVHLQAALAARAQQPRNSLFDLLK
jgi:flagellar hook-associated protein 3 FlgL